MNATLGFELCQADLEAFFEHHAGHAPYLVRRNRRMRWIWAVGFALLVLAYAWRSALASVVFGAIAVVFLAFYGRLNRWWYVRHNVRLNAGPDGPRLGPTRLEVAAGKLLVETPEGSSKLDLSAVRRIDESESHFFLYTGPASAIVVPRSAARADAFVRIVRESRPPDH